MSKELTRISITMPKRTAIGLRKASVEAQATVSKLLLPAINKLAAPHMSGPIGGYRKP